MPEALRAHVEQAWDTYIESATRADVGISGHPDFIKVLYKVWAYSDFVAQSCVRHLGLVNDLLDSGDLLGDYRADEYHAKLKNYPGKVKNQDALEVLLRNFRRREMVRIAWRDLAGWASLAETMRDLSALADACIDHAARILHQWQSEEMGVPMGGHSKTPQSLAIIGMGKLGANELNFSSDVDLVFAYPEGGETRRRSPATNDEYFVSLGQRLINALQTMTDAGFVYRVDMRLRPYGESGPLAMNFDAVEEYYQSQGREWERYAMIKARAVGGDRLAGQRFITMLRPFVYRRYLDFGAFESLREMKSLIGREVERKGLQDNIKLGPGGIREVEFIGQAFQLIWGGRKPELQERSILTVLQHLKVLGYLPEYVTRNLTQAYIFLRRVENRLQAVRDEQTHHLPDDEIDRMRLALSMGYKGWPVFAKQLAKHRQLVSDAFEQVFLAPQMGVREQRDTAEAADFTAIWAGEIEESQAMNSLTSAGFESAGETLRRLESLRDSYACRSLSARGRERMDNLVPLLMGAVAQSSVQASHRDRVLARLLELIESIASREVYLALLVENPLALSQLVRLCAASPWISALLASHPILFDELLDPRTLYAPLDRTALQRQLQLVMGRITPGDLEAEMDTLRHFKQANVLRVAAADVMGNMPLMIVSDHLTEIAEVILEKTLELAITHVKSRTGKRQGSRGGYEGFAIVGYGKLGGIELGYGSDLDLVFLHDQPDADDMEQGIFFSRLGQRIIHILNTHTPAGILYEVDMRLRPSGASGLLVSGIDAFEEYQRNDAWTWEFQALVRARVIAGDSIIKQRFEAIRREVLARERDPVVLRREVREMRERMRAELAQIKPGYFDIKQGAGGITDIEFIVQYGVLLWANRHPELLSWTDNIRLLEGFAQAGLMSTEDVRLMSDSYRAYRSSVHRLALQDEPALVGAGQFTVNRQGISEIWQKLLGD